DPVRGRGRRVARPRRRRAVDRVGRAAPRARPGRVSEAAPSTAVHDPARRRGRILAACLLLAFALLALPGLRRDSTTYDEPGFYMYGYGVLAKADFSRDGTQNSKMPIDALQAAPGYLREWLGGARAFKPEFGVWMPEEGALGLGRAVTLATALVL